MQTWQSDEPTGLKGDNILPAMYERGKTFGSPFKEVFATIPEGTRVWHNRLGYWPTKPWDSRGGLVTLAGDAAHPMTFREHPIRFSMSVMNQQLTIVIQIAAKVSTMPSVTRPIS